VTATLDLNLVAAFVRVIETGSFTAAAHALGLPKSSVSRRVTALESELGVRLVQRSTRQLVLTEAGRQYFERARASLNGLQEASAAAADMSHDVAGLIRFTMAPDTTGFMASLLAEFLQRYPKVRLEVIMTARRVDLVAEGIDVALRNGRLTDSTLVARRLGSSDLGLFASRAYLRREGKPARLADLEKHRFVLYRPLTERESLKLEGPRGPETVKVQTPLVADEMTFVADAIAAGVGIGLVPVLFFGLMLGPLRRGPRPEVVRVLPQYGMGGGDVHLVSPPTAYEPTRVALFRDFIAERFSPMLAKCELALGANKKHGA
jgi:DNA-binding transcriptional LysR family regulator